MSWPPNKVERLRELAGLRMSCSEIANKLSKEFNDDTTRNAVIGKSHRMNISINSGKKGCTHPAWADAPERSKECRHGVLIMRRKCRMCGVLGTLPDQCPECKEEKRQRDVRATKDWKARSRAKTRRSPAKYARPILERVDPDFVPPPSPVSGALAATMHLKKADCRYPIGDPREEDFRYCGAPRELQKMSNGDDRLTSYCIYHNHHTHERGQHGRKDTHDSAAEDDQGAGAVRSGTGDAEGGAHGEVQARPRGEEGHSGDGQEPRAGDPGGEGDGQGPVPPAEGGC